MGDAYNPFMGSAESGSPENGVNFLIRQALGRISTAMPVKIVKVTGGGVGPPGTVDVQPLIKMVDGVGGNPTSHAVIKGIPFTRGQGSGNVIINDPVVGDIGLMVIPHRDISSFKANNGAESAPGSRRRFDMADGIYMGSMSMQTTPTNYINLNGGKIAINSPGDIQVTSAATVTVNATNVKINGSVDING